MKPTHSLTWPRGSVCQQVPSVQSMTEITGFLKELGMIPSPFVIDIQNWAQATVDEVTIHVRSTKLHYFYIFSVKLKVKIK
jgi:hypothetical protein